MQPPTQAHMQAALHVLWYLKKDPHQGILLAASTSHCLTTKCDSDWTWFNPPLATVFCLVLLLTLREVRNKMLLLVLQLKLSIELLL